MVFADDLLSFFEKTVPLGVNIRSVSDGVDSEIHSLTPNSQVV